MERSALALLEDARARKLVATWGCLPPRPLDPDDELRTWADLAGVETSAARRIRPGLVASGIVAQDDRGIRVVDPEASAAVADIAITSMKFSAMKAPA
jgi:hypothetical protein